MEEAQKSAELSAELKVVQALLEKVPEENRREEAKRFLEDEFSKRHAQERKVNVRGREACE